MRWIYLDHNASTPLAPQVAEAMRPLLGGTFGNPSSSHAFGQEARAVVERAREQLAALLGCERDELLFTSGGTEANNLAIRGALLAARGPRRLEGAHLVTSAVEHPAVLEVCRELEDWGVELTVLPVDRHGRVSPAELEAALRPETVLVSIMHANNELGTVQPVAELARICHEHGVLLHSDGAQAVGKLPVDVRALGVDLYSVAGHKFYGPKGVGALYVRRGVALRPVLRGAGHERGLRPGTENTLGLAGLGAAAELARLEIETSTAHMRATRDRLLRSLRELLPELVVNGHPEERLPNTLNLSIPGVEADALLRRLARGSREDVAVAASAGAACHAGGVEISRVLRAIRLPEELARGTLRLSTGRLSTLEDMELAARAIAEAARELRGAPA